MQSEQNQFFPVTLMGHCQAGLEGSKRSRMADGELTG